MSEQPVYGLSEEHQAIREAVRELCAAKVAPFAAEVDEQGRYPLEALAALTAADFHAPHVPEEYGGAGADALATVLVIEEVARVCMASSLIPAVNKLGSLPVLLAGSEELRKTYLTKLAAGEGGFSYCLSEPEAGSDAAAMKTRATRDGDSWVLNGVKRWITNAGPGEGESEFYTVMAVTEPGLPAAERARGHLGVRGRARRCGRVVRGPGEEAGHQGVADPGGLPRQGADPGGADDRRGGHRVRDRDADPGPHPGDDRGAGGRGGAGRGGPRRWPTRGSGSSSASRSATSRGCSSCWPTWACGWRPPGS